MTSSRVFLRGRTTGADSQSPQMSRGSSSPKINTAPHFRHVRFRIFPMFVLRQPSWSECRAESTICHYAAYLSETSVAKLCQHIVASSLTYMTVVIHCQSADCTLSERGTHGEAKGGCRSLRIASKG